MAQQTAVDWLVNEIDMQYPELNIRHKEWMIDRAKAIEKEQLHKCASFWRGKEDDINKPMFNLYYNETYNK